MHGEEDDEIEPAYNVHSGFAFGELVVIGGAIALAGYTLLEARNAAFIFIQGYPFVTALLGIFLVCLAGNVVSDYKENFTEDDD